MGDEIIMIRALIFILFSLSSPYTFASSDPQPFHNPASTEITVSDLKWQSPEQLPQSIKQSKAYLKWLKNVYDEPPIWFAKIDVDGNEKTREILIASSLSGSGGRNFLLIAQTKTGEWNQLAAIFGAPIFIKSKPTGYSDLQTYHRNGLEMWLHLFKYNNGKYKFQTETLMPRAIVTECFYQRWLQMNLLGEFHMGGNFLNSWRIKMREICPELIKDAG